MELRRGVGVEREREGGEKDGGGEEGGRGIEGERELGGWRGRYFEE